ncbi:MAG: DHH family phosphoesterase [Methanopyri archaeon]|nr:DHH family phosphoesterase [Methanopyri archaeon]
MPENGCTDEDVQRVLAALTAARGGAFLITHQNADLDAAGACIALQELLKQLGIPSRIGSGSHASVAARKLIDYLDAEFEVRPPDPGGMPVLVDVQNPDQVAPLVPWKRPVVLDHHPYAGPCDYHASLTDDTSPSTCELVHRVFEAAGVVPTQRAAAAMIAGMVADTMSFRRAQAGTFRAMARLLVTTDVDYQEVLDAIHLEPDRSSRIAILKGAQRTELILVGPWIVTVTKVNSFEADVANALIRSGADIAFVGAKKKGGFRITARARKSFIKSTGIHVYKDLLVNIEAIIQGSGGGHDAAASVNGLVEMDEGIKALLRVLRERLGDEGHGR